MIFPIRSAEQVLLMVIPFHYIAKGEELQVGEMKEKPRCPVSDPSPSDRRLKENAVYKDFRAP